MKPLRFLIFSASFGAGHVKAAESLIHTLKNSDPNVEIFHEDYMSLYNKFLNTVLKKSYINMIKQTPKLWGTFYYSTQNLSYDSFFQRFVNNIGRKQLIDYIHELKPDMIICTYPTVAGLLAHLRTTGYLRIPLATVITDYTIHAQWIHPGVDLYVVGNTEVRDGLINRGISPDAIQVTGIPVSPKFDGTMNKKEALLKLGLSPERQTFLIMGGAYGVLGNAKWMYKLMATADAPIQAIIVCGNDRKLYRSLDPVAKEAYNPIVRYGFVNNVDELMTAADIIITKAGGLTVSEALTKHLPMIIFKPIPGQEANNASYIKSIGAGLITDTKQEFLHTFYELIENKDLIRQMSLAAAREYPGNSSQRAVQSILNLAYDWRTKKSIENISISANVS
ncbi:glycosyltransferase [Dehalobacter sp. TeCB1]|uniref:MGDG synthase family glycosyltransferase n=1 Tax=Dehalobacter sp. TeCB1 TaxID=1843715 RepID=UPI00083AD68E|nr:glycosyltransferase [Dehalobacter sp. TeCB1]OCZ49848.1 UDP-N-acetylglucosamine--LPS N-acetylglucosamine transferase [Dehalobacter sp. TeCB1]